MTDDRLDDLEQRLRAHYAALPPAPPTLRASILERVGERRRRRSLVVPAIGLVAASAAVVLVFAVLELPRSTVAPDLASRPPATIDNESTPAPPTPTSTLLPALPIAGDVLKLTRDFPPGYAGQLVYVAEGPELRGGEEQVLIQHWGDRTRGIVPNTTFVRVSAPGLAAVSTPYDPPCPDEVRSILDVARLQPFERLVCFGDRELVVGPVMVTDSQFSARWLSRDGTHDFFEALPVPPAGAGEDLPSGTWLEVTGRFGQDWPGCSGPHPIWCREQFVVTSYTEVDPPDFVYRGSWRRTIAPTGGRNGHGMTWTGREVFIWGGGETDLKRTVFDPELVRYGLTYDPERDVWRRTGWAPIQGRTRPSVEWSGFEVLVWGGSAAGGVVTDGAAYDPETDVWRRLPRAPLSAASLAFARMIDGRLVAVADGGSAIYDPGRDRWTEAPAPPIELRWATWAVAEGRLLVIEFNEGASTPVRGAVFDPQALEWTELDQATIPFEPLQAGLEAIDGGDEVYFPEAGWAVDPASGAWRRVTRCPAAANGGVWTGSRVLGVFGTYDPTTDRCLQLPEPPPRGAPFEETVGREFAVGVWTGFEYMTWSGGTGADTVADPNDGAIFRPEQP